MMIIRRIYIHDQYISLFVVSISVYLFSALLLSSKIITTTISFGAVTCIRADTQP
jgi:hypothetical protein